MVKAEDAAMVVFLIIIAFALGCAAGCAEGCELKSNEAVRMGVAEYEPDTRGEARFKWLLPGKVQPEAPAPLLPPCCNCGGSPKKAN